MRVMTVPLFLSTAAVFAGCSIHPLQDDVTRLPLRDIVFKIQCEAQDAIREIMHRENLWELRPLFGSHNDKITKKNNELKPLQKTQKELAKRRRELLATKSQILADRAALLHLNDVAPSTPGLNKKAQQIVAATNEYIRSISKYYEDLWRNSDLIDPLEKALALLQASKTGDKRIAKLLAFYGSQMVYNFRFNITETDALSITNLSYKFPVHLGSMTVGLAGSDTKQRESDRNVKLIIGFEDLDELDCRGAPQNAGGLRAVHYPIKGTIGIAEVIDQYLKILAFKEGKFDKVAAYTDQISFTTTLTGSVNPSFTIAPTPLTQVAGSFSAGGTRKDLHVVFISLASPSPDGTVEQITNVRLIKDEDDELFFPRQ